MPRPNPISTLPYNQVVIAGKTIEQRGRILGVLEFHGTPLNRRMIAAATKLPINVVCWRVDGMLKSGLLRVALIGKDPVTGQESQFLESTSVPPPPFQRRFEWPS